MSDRELDFPQLNGRCHGNTAQTGDTPAAGVLDLGNESVGMTPVENARDLLNQEGRRLEGNDSQIRDASEVPVVIGSDRVAQFQGASTNDEIR